uniref:G-protein coupled receptors family 1 profile domain-containing protein n=1 Tax=Chelonoidis abingdonii TaxID=106734 RepID=A0A8C0HAS4_CHEAB
PSLGHPVLGMEVSPVHIIKEIRDGKDTVDHLNGIVLWFLEFHIKRNIFTVYILNLAAADFGFLLCLPVGLNLINSFHLLSLLAYSTSLYLLTAISTERCVSVLFPICWCRCYHPKHLPVIVCALLWALFYDLLRSLPTLIFYDSMLHGCSLCLSQPLSSILTQHFLLLAGPTKVEEELCHTSLTLFIKVQSSSQQYQPGKLYIVIVLSLLLFLLFNFDCDINLITTTFLLAFLNSSINPNIYFLVRSYRNWQFRGSVKFALQRVFEHKAEGKGLPLPPPPSRLSETKGAQKGQGP